MEDQELLCRILVVAGESLRHDSGEVSATALIEAEGYLTEIENEGAAYTITITPNATRRTEAQAQHDREADAFRLGQRIALEAVQEAIGRVTIEPYSAADADE